MEAVHATAVSWYGRGILIQGPSGAGKSTLALNLIEAGAILIADDQAVLGRTALGVTVSSPPGIAGLLEVAGVGLIRLPYLLDARLALLVDLVAPDSVERLPDLATTLLAGHPIPTLRLAAREAAGRAKIIALLRARGDF